MRLGEWGEEIAARYLAGKGWSIVARNYRSARKEIDLVAARDGVIAFVEVKTRSPSRFGDGSEAVGRAKQLAIAAAAAAWIHEHGGDEVTYRFDVVTVARVPGLEPRIRHLEDAWRIEPTATHDLHEGVIFGFSI